MIKKGLLVSLLLISVHIYAQDALLIDSLKSAFKESAGTNRIEIMLEWAWQIKYNNPDSSSMLTNRALALSESSSYHRGIALAYRNLAAIEIIRGRVDKGLPLAIKAWQEIKPVNDSYQKGKILNLLAILYRENKKYRDALDYQEMAISEFRTIRDSSELVGNLNNLGMIYERLGNKDEALSLYLEVYDIEKACKNFYGISRVTNSLANIYGYLGKNALAKKFYSESIDYAQKINNLQFEAASLHGLANMYAGSGEPDKALEIYAKAVEINLKGGFGENLAKNYVNMGEVLSDQKEYEKALPYYNQAYTLFTQLNDPWNQVICMDRIARLLNHLNRSDEALHYALRSKAIADSMGDLVSQSDVYFTLFEIYKTGGKYKLALDYLENYIKSYDSIQANEKTRLIDEIQTRYEVNTITAQNKLLKSENELKSRIIRNQRLIGTAIVVIVVLLLAMALFLIYSRRKLSRLNNELAKRAGELANYAAELNDSNATKNRLFSIIAHDIRNPFSAVLNFSELLLDDFETADKDTLKYYASNINKASHSTFQLLDNLLYWSKSQRGTIELNREEVNIHELVKMVLQTGMAGANARGIELSNLTDAGLTALTDRTLLRIVLGNLVGNAIKFNRDNGQVIISASRSDTMIEISIADTGPGIDQARIESLFSKEKSVQPSGVRNTHGTGLGLVLCHDFCEKLGGSLSVESEAGKGSVFNVKIPIE